jgi:hypothetical protein
MSDGNRPATGDKRRISNPRLVIAVLRFEMAIEHLHVDELLRRLGEDELETVAPPKVDA